MRFDGREPREAKDRRRAKQDTTLQRLRGMSIDDLESEIRRMGIEEMREILAALAKAVLYP